MRHQVAVVAGSLVAFGGVASGWQAVVAGFFAVAAFVAVEESWSAFEAEVVAA
jgi:hypothetical protein